LPLRLLCWLTLLNRCRLSRLNPSLLTLWLLLRLCKGARILPAKQQNRNDGDKNRHEKCGALHLTFSQLPVICGIIGEV